MGGSRSRIALVGGLLGLAACRLFVDLDGLSGGATPAADAGADVTTTPEAGTAPADAAPDTGVDGGVDAEAGSRPPSCDGTPGAGNDCGLNKQSDCCTTLTVPGGAYFRSNDNGAPANLSSFRLDRYEVTVGRFNAFIAAGYGTQAKAPATGAGAHPKVPGSGWDPSYTPSLPIDGVARDAAVRCTGSTFDQVDKSLPASCIDWYLAMAFCIWDGGRLPSEAEWNYAAAGGSDQRVYPWSAPPSSTTIDGTYAVYDCTDEADAGLPCPSGKPSAPLPVGSRSPKGDGRWGHADLAGNIIEWTLDWNASYDATCNDCVQLDGGSGVRSDRDYGFTFKKTGLRTPERNSDAPSLRIGVIGVRCARDF